MLRISPGHESQLNSVNTKDLSNHAMPGNALVTVLGPENRQSGDHRATAKKRPVHWCLLFFS